MSDSLVPSAVARIGEKIAAGGRECFLVGPGLRDLLTGMHPSHFELSTDASLEEILECFPSGVLIKSTPATVMIPDPAGPIEVTPYSAGTRIEDELACRDFTLNAVAYETAAGKWLDPHRGRADLEKGLIRAVGCARDGIDADPIRALRALRLAATRGWSLDRELEAALSRARTALAEIPRELPRRELSAILLSAGVAEALEQLDRSGISSVLAPGARANAGALIARLPSELELRLAAWLRGANARSALQRLRFPRATVERVALLVRGHDELERAEALRPAAAARFARRAGIHNLDALIALRETELALDSEAPPAAREVLRQLRTSLAALHDREQAASARGRLSISGAEVMACLGCGPSPHVGRAIDYLAERIRLDPKLNTPDALRGLLRAWAAETGGAK